MQTMVGLSLPQGLAAILFSLIYFSYLGFGCRLRAERYANTTIPDGETAGDMFPPRSCGIAPPQR